MNEAKSGFVGFLKNKNTITILGTLLAVGILIFGYYYQINKAVTKVNILVAKEDISPNTQITANSVELVEVTQEMRAKMERKFTENNMESIFTYNIFTGTSSTNDQFPNGAYANVMIPKGSVLVKGVNVVDKSKIPSDVFSKITEGDIPYAFAVNPENTYGNAIMPGMYVDIYMKAVNDDNKVMIGRFIKDVKVLAVLDSSGRNVFENPSEQRVTAKFIFGVNDYYHLLFRKASYLTGNGVELIPVPVTKSIDSGDYKGSIAVTSKQLEEFINSKTVNVVEEDLPDSTVEKE